ncbi:MAG: Hdr-like menaquinol oxidoreductase cytochrome c subunit [Gammaproteobacteria bacterium]|nr:Hdr-like menaquinol oxidoreductase cytochrome c subunit [Gammaproteobacteria bacterium]
MAGLLALPLSTQAGDPPQVAKGKGDACVEPTDVMRRDHMDFLMHQRDDTMRQGIRTKKYSLNECLECHVQPDESGEVARIDSPDHFCSTCHTYAAVKVDCFECHSDLPKSMNKAAYKHKLTGDDMHHAGIQHEDISKGMLDAIVAGGESK